MTTTSWDELVRQSAGSFDPLPDGDYDVVCVDAQAAKTQTGKGMVKAKFRVTGGPHDGRHLWNQFVISPENPNALSFFFQHMKVFGMDTNFFTQLPPVNPDLGADDPALNMIAQTMVNRAARVKTTQRSFQGQQRNEIKAITPAFGPAGVAVAQPQIPGVPAAYPQAAVPQPQMPAPVAPQPVYAAPAAPAAPVAYPQPVAQPPASPMPPTPPAPQAPAPPVSAPPQPQFIAPPPAPQEVAPQVPQAPQSAPLVQSTPPAAPQPVQLPSPPAPPAPPQEIAF